MGKEIERKFKVKNNTYKSLAIAKNYRQGYIPTLNGMTVRVRIAGDQGYITLKDHAKSLTRHEYEYPIPVEDAKELLELMCSRPQIEKLRHVIPATGGHLADGTPVEGLHWEVDEFCGDNEGLVIAEIEIPSEDTQFDIPDWIGEEVTGDKRYYNSHLCSHPYKDWK